MRTGLLEEASWWILPQGDEMGYVCVCASRGGSA